MFSPPLTLPSSCKSEQCRLQQFLIREKAKQKYFWQKRNFEKKKERKRKEQNKRGADLAKSYKKNFIWSASDQVWVYKCNKIYMWVRCEKWILTGLACSADVLGEGNDNPLQYSCLESPMDRGPGGLQSMGLLRVRYYWATSLSLFSFMHWRRKWQPTSVFLPGMGEPGGLLSMGLHRVGHDWSDLAAAARAI